MIAVWLVGKLALYSAMAVFAAWLFRFRIDNMTGFALKYGIGRMLLGVLAGFLILFVWTSMPESWGDVPQYAVSFGAVRYLEWLIVLVVMSLNQGTTVLKLGWRGQLWLFIGVAANFAMDQVALHMEFNVKFYC